MQKWNESGFRPPLCTYRLNWARRTSWGWWDDWDDTVLQTQDSKFLAVWGRARYLSVTEAPHNTNFHTWMGKKQFCFFQTAESGNRTPDSGVKGSGANHYPRAPALQPYATSPWTKAEKKYIKSRCDKSNVKSSSSWFWRCRADCYCLHQYDSIFVKLCRLACVLVWLCQRFVQSSLQLKSHQ